MHSWISIATIKFPKTSAFVFNLRFPQLLFHAGSVLVGFGLGIGASDSGWIISFLTFLKLALVILGVWSAWIASVIVNDVVDLKIDCVSNPERPLPRKIFSVEEYLGIGSVFFFLSIIFSGLADWRIIFFTLLYQLTAFLYSAWPLRLKRFPIIATLTSAFALIIVAFSGFTLTSPEHSLSQFPIRIAILLTIGFTLAFPVKDFKDFEGDKQDNIATLPIVFGIPWAKVIVGSGIFFSFMLSVIVLRDFHLFWWAFFCGCASFFFILQMQKPSPERWLNYRTIFWWIMGATTIYLGALIYFLFLK